MSVESFFFNYESYDIMDGEREGEIILQLEKVTLKKDIGRTERKEFRAGSKFDIVNIKQERDTVELIRLTDDEVQVDSVWTFKLKYILE